MIALGDPFPALPRPGWTEPGRLDEQPPGWYRDPENARRHRYWDGESWTVTETDGENEAQQA